MSLENDKNFNFLYNEQYENIPKLFRFSRKRCIASFIVIGVFFIAAMIFLRLFNDSAEYVKIPSLDSAHFFGFNEYNYTFLVFMILCFVVIAVIAAWMAIARLFEQRAFKKATKLANMIFLTERHKQAVDWSNWKMHNRDY